MSTPQIAQGFELPCIIYCHGLLGTKNEFDFLALPLKSEFQFFSFNFDGHGETKYIPEWSITNFATQLANFIDHNNLKDYHIIGYSLGGYVAAYALLQKIIFPAFVITINTKWEWPCEVVEVELKKLGYESIQLKAPKLIQHWNAIHTNANAKEMLARAQKFLIQMQDLQIASISNATNNTIPIYITHGERDKFVTEQESQKISHVIATTSYLTIPGMQHPLESIDKDFFLNFLREKLNPAID
ncbi:MAG: alpha/beta fold hydrolase [Bacteroidetes bacterium]|nr:alpha/beta fold hydrolase [Bacteroidota bacterium]